MKIKLLIVDDTDHVRDMLATMLDLDGFDVVATASSGLQALQLIHETQPHIVVMDFKMPDMDGITATKRIRELSPNMPVILYTAYLDRELESRARAAGVSLCVGKVEGIESLERQISQMSLELADVDIR
jgi:DNA-binding NarL/FixJ family response regulator